MKLYLFSPVEPIYKEEFYKHIRPQNLKVTAYMAFIVLLIVIAIRVASWFIPYQAMLPPFQFREYKLINNSMIGGSFLFTVLLYIVRKKASPLLQNQYHFICLLYALFFIGSCMALTFVAQHNPANTMTMLLIGTLGIAVLLVFSLGQLLLISGISITVFLLFFHIFQVDPETRSLNYISFWLIITAFLFVSRLLYSYHANYFIKIRTIGDKNREIAQANLLKTEILGIVAHDLRNPISGIRTIIHLMEEYPYTKEQEDKYLTWIRDACHTADHIIEELLAAAKRREPDKLQTDYVSLNAWLETVRASWIKQNGFGRNVMLELPQQELKAHIHTSKLQRVVDNLLHNAVKFTPADGRITLGLHTHRGGIRIFVSDTGIGIPQDMQPALFDRFTPSGRPGLNEEPSNGLGLHICKQLVEEHGGSIFVESRENKGAVFNIDLPYTLL
ncbi:sensor histidine kinase [Chitinophaga tropicalis]|uniref:histidine kinase n=1 Tax=Chitinophaga tropicalis TaxID=2683588 RepID=A0A7K1UCV3_9BACT|nr:HAMP domain-containing sensor histidine kinase [Chitinophaga tropicalis]MVT12207.1 hypothetical protein [Chitinophaga tropicalis]